LAGDATTICENRAVRRENTVVNPANLNCRSVDGDLEEGRVVVGRAPEVIGRRRDGEQRRQLRVWGRQKGGVGGGTCDETVLYGVLDSTDGTKAVRVGSDPEGPFVGVDSAGKELDEKATVDRVGLVVETLKGDGMNASWPLS
jgi:hypothetical protein